LASVHEFPYFHVVEISYSLHRIALSLSPLFDNAGQWQNNTYSCGIPLFLLLPQYKTADGLPVEFVFHRSTADYAVSLHCLSYLQQTSLFPLSWKASIFAFKYKRSTVRLNGLKGELSFPIKKNLTIYQILYLNSSRIALENTICSFIENNFGPNLPP